MFKAIDAYKAETFEILEETTERAFLHNPLSSQNIIGPRLKYAKKVRTEPYRSLISYSEADGNLTQQCDAKADLLESVEYDGSLCRPRSTSCIETFYTRGLHREKSLYELIQQEQSRLSSYTTLVKELLEQHKVGTAANYSSRPFARALRAAQVHLAEYLRRKRRLLASKRNRLKKLELRPGRDGWKSSLRDSIERLQFQIDHAALRIHAPRYRYRFVNLITNQAIRSTIPHAIPSVIPLPTRQTVTFAGGVECEILLSKETDTFGYRTHQALRVNCDILAAWYSNMPAHPEWVTLPLDVPRPSSPLIVEIGIETVAKTLRRMVPSSRERVSVPLFLLEIADIKNSLTAVRTQVAEAAGLVNRNLQRLTSLLKSGRDIVLFEKAVGFTAKNAQLSDLIGRKVAYRAASRDLRQLITELANTPMESLRLLSAADLNRKFGLLPGVRDITEIIHGLSKKGKWMQECVRALKNRGSARSFSYVVNRQTYEQTRTVKLRDLIGYVTTVHGSMGSIDLNQRINSLVADLSSAGFDTESTITYVLESAVEDRLSMRFSYDYVDALGHPLLDEEVKGRWFLDNLGLNLNLGFIWDHLPYSFVVDWMLDVGSYLESRLGTRWIKASVMPQSGTLTRKVVTKARITGIEPGASWSFDDPLHPGNETKIAISLDVADGRTLFIAKQYRREVLSPETLASLIKEAHLAISPSSPSLWKAVTWAEMLSSR